MIRIENLTKRYGTVEALKEMTLAFPADEVLAVVGPSGCGKTTLLRLVAGLEVPDDGIIVIDGREVSSPTQMAPPHARGLSMIFQDLALWPHMTVREHVEFVLKKGRLSGDRLRSEANRVLKDTRVDGVLNRYPHQLSGGEKQRLAIARALASNTKYLLMDEPFSNLDPMLKEELRDLILRLRSNLRMGIIYVTHHAEEVFLLADTVAVMNEGKLEQTDRKENVVDNPKNEFVRRLLGIR